MAVEQKRRAFGVALQTILDDATEYALMDGDPSRLAALVEADLLLKQFTQDGFLVLDALGSAFRIAALPRLELMLARRFSVTDVVLTSSALFGWRFSFSGFGHFALP